MGRFHLMGEIIQHAVKQISIFSKKLKKLNFTIVGPNLWLKTYYYFYYIY